MTREQLFEPVKRGHAGAEPGTSGATQTMEEASMYIGVGTIVLILVILLIVFMVRR